MDFRYASTYESTFASLQVALTEFPPTVSALRAKRDFYSRARGSPLPAPNANAAEEATALFNRLGAQHAEVQILLERLERERERARTLRAERDHHLGRARCVPSPRLSTSHDPRSTPQLRSAAQAAKALSAMDIVTGGEEVTVSLQAGLVVLSLLPASCTVSAVSWHENAASSVPGAPGLFSFLLARHSPTGPGTPEDGTVPAVVADLSIFLRSLNTALLALASFATSAASKDIGLTITPTQRPLYFTFSLAEGGQTRRGSFSANFPDDCRVTMDGGKVVEGAAAVAEEVAATA